MAHAYYLSSGLCRQQTRPDALDGMVELFLYNPGDQPSQATVTIYFEDRPPHTLPPLEIPPLNRRLLVMPDMDRALFEDCGFWGARIVGTTPLLTLLIAGTLFDGTAGRAYEGGVSHFLGTGLHHHWYFADGLWLEWKRFYSGDLSKAPHPYNELEYYYFLNPGPRDTEVRLTLQFRDLEPTTLRLAVPAKRVAVWCNYEQVPFNQPYGVTVVSTEPISTTSVRYIYALSGFAEWGLNLHAAMPAEPGPITA